MKEFVSSNLFLVIDDSCLVYQHNLLSKIEQSLNKKFSNIFHGFVNNKLSIKFGEDKAKYKLLGVKQQLDQTVSLNIRYKARETNQYHTKKFISAVL